MASAATASTLRNQPGGLSRRSSYGAAELAPSAQTPSPDGSRPSTPPPDHGQPHTDSPPRHPELADAPKTPIRDLIIELLLGTPRFRAVPAAEERLPLLTASHTRVWETALDCMEKHGDGVTEDVHATIKVELLLALMSDPSIRTRVALLKMLSIYVRTRSLNAVTYLSRHNGYASVADCWEPRAAAHPPHPLPRARG